MTPSDRSAGFHLLENGVATVFRVLNTEVIPGTDDGEFAVKVDLKLSENDEDAADEVEWAAHGLIFVLALLSFADARPRESSAIDYLEEDEFTVADFHEALQFRHGALRFYADCVRGRRMKTDITVRADGSVTIQTQGRGKAVLRWLDRLQGKQPLELVRRD